jgi:hypothetical protein
LATKHPDMRLRWVIGVVGPLALVVAAVWVYAVLPRAADLYGRAAGTAPTVTVAGMSAPTPTAAPSTSALRLPTPAAGTPTSTPATRGATGPGLTEPGVRISATTTTAGTLQVSERVVVRAATGRIELAPPDLSDAGDQFSAAFPRVTQLRLTAGSQPVALSFSLLEAPRTIVLGLPIHTYELRYVLAGASVHSVPSASGRALAALSPVSRSLTPPSPVVLVTRGKAVRNLSCPLLSGNDVACSDGVRGAMSVRTPLPLRYALVVLQLDLPRP